MSVENSILFDDENKAFSICDGSIGIYRYEDVVKGQIMNMQSIKENHQCFLIEC